MSELATDDVVGYQDGKPLYAVSISAETLRRARELSAAVPVPSWLEMFAAPVGVCRVATTDPVWFRELERQVINASADRTRFGRL